jgi:hypothetical protein
MDCYNFRLVGNSEVIRSLGLEVDSVGNGKGVLLEQKQKELKLTRYTNL